MRNKGCKKNKDNQVDHDSVLATLSAKSISQLVDHYVCDVKLLCHAGISEREIRNSSAVHNDACHEPAA